MSTSSTTEPTTTTTTSPSTESKPQPAPAPAPLLSYAARAAKSLPPPSADLPTPISTPGKSINAPSTTPATNNQPQSSSSANKGSKSSRASRSSRPERSAAHPASSSGKNASTGGRNPSSRKHGGGGGGENKPRGGGNKEGGGGGGGAGSSAKTPAVEGGPSVVDGEGAVATSVANDTPAVPPPAPKPAPLPLVNIWKTRADAVKPNEKEGGHKSSKSHKSHNHNHANKSTSTAATTSAPADASPRSTDPSHPSFPSLADAPAPSTKRSSSANPQRPARTNTLPNGESWPEPSPASIALARAGNAAAEDDASPAGGAGGKAGKKEKTKWVAISPIELQLSADLASDRSKKSRPRRIPNEDASAVPPPRVNDKKKASTTSGAAPNTTTTAPTPSTSSAPSKKSTSSKKNDITPDLRLPAHGSTSGTAPPGEDGGKTVVFGSVEGGETDPLVSMAASMPSPSRQLHGLPPLAGVGGVSLGIEGMMRKDEEVVEVSSEVERSLLRSAADARSPNASLFSPPSPDILPFDLQPAPHFSNSPSANGNVSLNSPSSSSAKASDLAPQGSNEDASSKPLHTPAPRIAVRITAPGPNYVNGKAPTSSSSAARGGRGGAQSSRGGLPGGRSGSSSRGGANGGGPAASAFTNRNNPFAAPFHQMQQQQASHNGGPLPINGAGGAPYLTSPLPTSNGILATPTRNTFSPPLSSPYAGGPFPPSFHPHHQSQQHASFSSSTSVPLVRGPSQTSAASSTTTTLPPPAPAPTSITHHPNGNPNTSFPHHYAHAPPPMPMPVTVPSFPLDPLRFYLLGQLEYYFGVQNLAMDFFLRQQMDTLGFVSIPLIATFNRVKNLTSDLAIVREMMALSTIFEVRGDKVRLSNRGWEQWTLPGAVKSEEAEEVGGEKGVDKEKEKEEVVVGQVEKKVEENEKAEEELTQDEKDEREVEEATLSI